MTVDTGPFRAGDWVRLTDPKGRKHNIQLENQAEFSTKKGQVRHDDIIGQPEGIIITTSMDFPYQVFRPLQFEYVVSMPRGAAIIYPKDTAQILVMADIFPGARVLEAGAGSGSLSSYLLRAIGEKGQLISYELREEFAENARRNVAQSTGEIPENWSLRIGDVKDAPDDLEVDRLILDMVDPWNCIPLAARTLVSGGVVCAYVATTTQLSRFVETLRAEGTFTEPSAWETLVREWHLEGLAVRPKHSMNGHTAFLVTARKLAPGHKAMPRTRRPAPGAYGPDYTGPRPHDLIDSEEL